MCILIDGLLCVYIDKRLNHNREIDRLNDGEEKNRNGWKSLG